jgi:hypothetical protein
MAKFNLSHAELLERIDYDPLTGVFSRRYGARKGPIKGYVLPSGYVYICVGGGNQYAHRLAVFYMTGKWPEGDVDHDDQDKSNTRWKNLIPCTKTYNQHHRPRLNKNNTSGYAGVRKNGNNWSANITVGGKHIYLGTWPTKEEANQHREAAKRQLHEWSPAP